MTTILVVDDEIGLAECVCELLALSGYAAVSAWNGRLALAKIEEHAPDIILLDLMMPIMDGYAVLRALIENRSWANIKVVVMSSVGVIDGAERARCAAMLAKPFDLDELLATLACVTKS